MLDDMILTSVLNTNTLEDTAASKITIDSGSESMRKALTIELATTKYLLTLHSNV
jgi:hypothetical protein